MTHGFITDWYGNNGTSKSTETRLLFRPGNGEAAWEQLGSTEKTSEIILNIEGEKVVAYGERLTINGYNDVIKNVDTVYDDEANTKPYKYTEYYIKPGIGIVEIDKYYSTKLGGTTLLPEIQR